MGVMHVGHGVLRLGHAVADAVYVERVRAEPNPGRHVYVWGRLLGSVGQLGKLRAPRARAWAR